MQEHTVQKHLPGAWKDTKHWRKLRNVLIGAFHRKRGRLHPKMKWDHQEAHLFTWLYKENIYINSFIDHFSLLSFRMEQIFLHTDATEDIQVQICSDLFPRSLDLTAAFLLPPRWIVLLKNSPSIYSTQRAVLRHCSHCVSTQRQALFSPVTIHR